jgi:hypothetical protein
LEEKVKSIAVMAAIIAVFAFAVEGATAKLPERPGKERHAVGFTLAVETKQARKVAQVRPIVLPNIAKLAQKMRHVDRSTLKKQLIASEKVVRFWTHRGKWIRATRHEKCWQVPWQRSCTVARASYKLHEKLASIAEDRLVHEIPLINDWQLAVSWVQRIYPGTESWMLDISDREGGWGPWVWYRGACSNPPCLWHGYHVGNDYLGADTVGGWMQFRYSTFAPYWRGAQKDLRSRGFIIPDIPMPPEGGDPEYAAWLSPIGQALTAAYMRATGRDGCHWCL